MQPSFEGTDANNMPPWKCLCWDRLRQPALAEICDDNAMEDSSVVDIMDEESLPFNQNWNQKSSSSEEASSAGGSIWQRRAPGLQKTAPRSPIDRKNGPEAAKLATGNIGGRQRSLLSKPPLARTTGGGGGQSSSSTKQREEKDYAQMTALVFVATFAGSLCIGAGVFFYTRRKDRKKQQQQHNDKAPNNTMVSVSLQDNQQQQREQHLALVKRVPVSEHPRRYCCWQRRRNLLPTAEEIMMKEKFQWKFIIYKL
jgi:hypothetical protein